MVDGQVRKKCRFATCRIPIFVAACSHNMENSLGYHASTSLFLCAVLFGCELGFNLIYVKLQREGQHQYSYPESSITTKRYTRETNTVQTPEIRKPLKNIVGFEAVKILGHMHGDEVQPRSIMIRSTRFLGVPLRHCFELTPLRF